MTNFLFIIFGIMIYLLPTLVAFGREHSNKTAIFVMNIILGWTCIGWVALFIYSFWNTKK